MMPAKSDSLSPAISVIMPVYNGDNYLREALDSILGQTFENFELIIVDDGSNDGSSEIITSYRDPRIKVIRNPLNLGLVEALNVAIQSSVGRYIARHDCDDISHPDRLSMQYLIMEEMQADICGTGWVTMSSEGSILQEQQNPVNEDAIFACLAANVPFPHGSVMMRSSFMRKHHLHYENRIYYAEDFSLWVRFAEAGARFANLPESLYFYRVHPQSISSIKKNLFRASAKRIRRDFVKKNIVRSKEVLGRLTKDVGAIKALNYRETIYAAVLAYRLPLSWNSSAKLMRIFWHASMRQKIHIFYTLIMS